MSIEAINWALNVVKNVTSTQKSILIALADRANADGECWPSYDDICARSCATRNTVYSSLKKMEELGLLSKTRRFSKSTVYKLHISTHFGDISSTHFGDISNKDFGYMDSTNIDTLTINEPSIESAQKRKRFVPPTLDEVKAYCKERGNSVDPNRFLDHYEANGWVQGRGKKIKCWKAAVRTWEKNSFNKSNTFEGVL